MTLPTTSPMYSESLRAEIRRRRAAAAVAAAKVAAGQEHVIAEARDMRLVHRGVRVLLQVKASPDSPHWSTIRDVYLGDRAAVAALVRDLIAIEEETYDYLVGAGLFPDLDLDSLDSDLDSLDSHDSPDGVGVGR